MIIFATVAAFVLFGWEWIKMPGAACPGRKQM
jgi:hypothetical protein